jgi:N-sulfoglucosamine sulfohydrolase
LNGLTFKAMQRAAETQQSVAERVEMLLHRVPEEFYDFQADPNALRNLVSDPKYKDQIQKMREEMLAWMEQTKDPLLEKYRERIHAKE